MQQNTGSIQTNSFLWHNWKMVKKIRSLNLLKKGMSGTCFTLQDSSRGYCGFYFDLFLSGLQVPALAHSAINAFYSFLLGSFFENEDI